MANLMKYQEIKTKDGQMFVVSEKLGEGGQGAVYAVAGESGIKALKWYSRKKLLNFEKFYANIENNMKKGKPSNVFIWPEAITEKQEDSFGYVMDILPTDYKELTKIIIGRENFKSVMAMSNASLQIASGFNKLHQKGYIFQDFNDGNVYINPTDGNVLICDTDNVCEFGKLYNVIGKSQYIAPEIITDNANPDVNTDVFSLSIVLFMLWINNHPLEGKAAVAVPLMDEKTERKIYYENPVFIWDPSNDTNRPVNGIHKGAIDRWPILPKYLQETFIKAFGKEALNNPQKRVSNQEWINIFNRMIEEKFEGN